MAVNVVVLGDGTGGLVVSNLLSKEARRKGVDVNVRLIGNSPMHTYQPGLLFLPFRKPGYRTLADIQRPNADFIGAGVEYLVETITAIDAKARTVTTDKGSASPTTGWCWRSAAARWSTRSRACPSAGARARTASTRPTAHWGSPVRWRSSTAATSWSTSPRCRSSARWRRSSSSAWSTST